MEAKKMTIKSLQQSQKFLTGGMDGLTQEAFAWSPGAECNNIAFTLWHTVRLEDFFVNRVIQRQKELYTEEGWQEKLGTPDKTYQLTVEELQSWPVPKLQDLKSYAETVREKTLSFLNSIPDENLDEVPRPDRSPAPQGASISMIATEIALQPGQICHLRGMTGGRVGG